MKVWESESCHSIGGNSTTEMSIFWDRECWLILGSYVGSPGGLCELEGM